jgi:hypothetical protein
MVDFNEEEIVRRAADEVSEEILKTSGEHAQAISDKYGIDKETVDVVLAHAFLLAAAATCSVAYGVDDEAIGNGFNSVIREALRTRTTNG